SCCRSLLLQNPSNGLHQGLKQKEEFPKRYNLHLSILLSDEVFQVLQNASSDLTVLSLQALGHFPMKIKAFLSVVYFLYSEDMLEQQDGTKDKKRLSYILVQHVPPIPFHQTRDPSVISHQMTTSQPVRFSSENLQHKKLPYRFSSHKALTPAQLSVQALKCFPIRFLPSQPTPAVCFFLV